MDMIQDWMIINKIKMGDPDAWDILVHVTVLDDVSYCIFRKNRALAPHERSAVPLGTDHCPVC